MPSIRLKFPKAWYERIETAAEQSNQTPEQLLRGFIALSIAPPSPRGHSCRLPKEEALIHKVGDLCRTIDAARDQLVSALNGLAHQPRRKPRVAAARAVSSSRLKAAMKRKGVTHAKTAAHLGVARTAVTHVARGAVSLPPTWVETLNELFGEDWLHE